jgi:hypothetical protein
MAQAKASLDSSSVPNAAPPPGSACDRTRPGGPEGGPPEKPAGLTARAALLALVLQVGIIFWVVRSEVTARVFVSSWSLPMPGVLALLLLLLANRTRRRPWSQRELLLVYLTLSTTVMLVGYNFIQLLIPAITSPFYYATVENRWERMHPYLPAWLVPQDPQAIRDLFRGEASVPWAVWLGPLAAWGALIFALCIATLSLNVMLSRQWIQRERITFPVATLPLEMTSPHAPLFHNRLLWLGFGLAAVGQSLCGVHYYAPVVPAVPLTLQLLNDRLVEAPWVALQPLAFGFTPFYLGLAFLAPTDVQFSIWFFYWLGKAQRLLAFHHGYLDPTNLQGGGAPYLNEQTIGGFLAMGVVLLGRVGIGRWAVGGGKSVNRLTGGHNAQSPTPNAQRPTPERLSLAVFALSVAFIVAFLAAAGMRLPLAGGMVALYFVMVTAITRVRAEAGFAWAYGPDRNSASLTHIAGSAAGTRSFTPGELSALGFFHWFWWDLRFSPMPAQFEALKIGDAVHIRQRALVQWIIVATVVALLVGGYAALRDSYLYGWATAKVYVGVAGGAKSGYLLVNQWWDNPTGADGTRAVWTGLGGSVTLLLIAARQRLVWWPFHPIGYVMAGTPTAYVFWSNYLAAWLLKVALLHYGGMRLYRAAVPFFVGLTLGDLATQATWSLVTSILDVPVYQFL